MFLDCFPYKIMPYSTNFGSRKLATDMTVLDQSIQVLYPSKIYILADLLCKAAHLPMIFAKAFLGSNPPKFSTIKLLCHKIHGNLKNMLILYSVNVNRILYSTHFWWRNIFCWVKLWRIPICLLSLFVSRDIVKICTVKYGEPPVIC